MSGEIAPGALVALLEKGTQVAVLDVREEAPYSLQHLLYASTMPLARLELMLPARVPSRSCPIVLCDADGRSEALEAAQRLAKWGYRDVRVLAGGNAGWAAAGFTLYGGMHTPSKAFGEAVEVRLHTPKLSVTALHELRQSKAPHVLIDCRPHDEYLKMSLPGSINLPGVELTYRFAEVVRDPKIQVIVHCAGRTRSIMGAQTLIESGVPNPVRSLENGTMGWLLAGHEAATPDLDIPENDDLAHPAPRVRAYAEALAAKHGIGRVDEVTAARWLSGDDGTVTCLLDVRSPAEYEAGHLAGAWHSPGGQLIQATDKYLVVRNARVILTDDDGVRATIAASWLKRMGWRDVHVLPMQDCAATRVVGAEPRQYLIDPAARTRWITPQALNALIASKGAHLFDLDNSIEYEAAHLERARFVKRKSLGRLLPTLEEDRRVVLTSADGIVARVAAAEYGGKRPIWVLEGGKAAWKASGLPLRSGPEVMLDPPDEMWRRPVEAPGDRTAHMQNYLKWEIGLIEQVDRDSTVRFLV